MPKTAKLGAETSVRISPELRPLLVLLTAKLTEELGVKCTLYGAVEYAIKSLAKQHGVKVGENKP